MKLRNWTKKSLGLFLLIIVCLVPSVSSALFPEDWHWRKLLKPYNNLYKLAFGQNMYVAVGSRGIILKSADGDHWIESDSGTKRDLRGIAYGNDTFVAVGSNGVVLVSHDGSEWVKQTSGITAKLSSITFGNNLFVAVAFNGNILTSPDGSAWTLRRSGKKDTLSSVTYGGRAGWRILFADTARESSSSFITRLILRVCATLISNCGL